MLSGPAPPEVVRRHAELLLESIGISRIIIVDDEYAAGSPEVEELIGLCSELEPGQAATLPQLTGVDFGASEEIWAEQLRGIWPVLDGDQPAELLAQARALLSKDVVRASSATGSLLESGSLDDAADEDTMTASAEPGSQEEDHQLPEDTRAAQALEDLLGGLSKCAFETLSLSEWNERSAELLEGERARETVFLFDRDFRREQSDSENEGFELVRAAQRKAGGLCGLITHTVPLGGDRLAWSALADEQNLDRDRFVVIAKERLTGDSPDHYSFLRMLRLVALSGRCAAVKSAAWAIFQASITEAKAAVERLSVLDFDQIVLASSRREGIWEPETLFRVFGILMRDEARQRLYGDAAAGIDMPAVVSDARRVSGLPEEVAAALGEEPPSQEALRIQRSEAFESGDALSRYCLPVELGDIFERPSTHRRYILLAQPCDLMVRSDGKRNYDDRYGRSGALVQLSVGRGDDATKDSCASIPYYDATTGAPAYADFARAHQVQLAVLDLCALREGGSAEIEIGVASPPPLVIEPWRRRHGRLQQFFGTALERYEQLGSRQVNNELRLLALPLPSPTALFPVSVDGKAIRYDLKRVMRLRQPRSGALLTAMTQYQARTAFEHPFDHRLPMPSADGAAQEGTGGDQEE